MRPTEVLPGPGNIRPLAAVGGAIITRRVALHDNAGDPRSQELVKVIRAADATMVNLELSTFLFSEFRGWPEVENGGNRESVPRAVASTSATARGPVNRTLPAYRTQASGPHLPCFTGRRGRRPPARGRSA